jgi:tripartite-type tricarboxylate transporter receptor subunit TctC
VNLSSIAPLAVAAVTCTTSGFAADTQFPTRPIRKIVASSVGTGADIFARSVAQGLTDIYKEQVVVENRVGAGGLISSATAHCLSYQHHHASMVSRAYLQI